VQLAFRARPDLAALNDRSVAAKQFASAEHDLQRPTVSALATGGGTPIRADQIQSSWYGAAGANVSIPIFNGFEFTARAREADLRAQVASEQVRNLREAVAQRRAHSGAERAVVLSTHRSFEAVARSIEHRARACPGALQSRLERHRRSHPVAVGSDPSRISYANARYAYQTALAEVRFQTGQ